jgi:anti-sigma regulatory factor (Ser/Thr protein kinase)
MRQTWICAMAPDTPASTRWETNLPNRLESLMRALDDLEVFLERCGADAQARYVARLAVEELGTNILKYGYDDQGQHFIGLSAEYVDPEFRIRLQDDGHEFDPCQAVEPDPERELEVRMPGGWGISLVRRLVSRMEYERRDGWNTVCVSIPRCSGAL